MDKNIRSKVVKESLLDYNTLAKSLEENSQSAIKTLLGEAVRDTYAKLLSEDDDKDYEEEEVEDTNSDITTDDAESSATTDDVEDGDTSMDAPEEGGEEGDDADDSAVEGGSEDVSLDEPTEDDGADEGDEWAEFDKYKVSDDEYDFSNAEDEEIVKVYKLMKNDDQILVNKDDNGNVNIQDNETGAEYLISLGNDGGAADVAATEPSDDVITDDEGTDDFGGEGDFENEDYEDMNESTERMFELVLEYNSNVGYTDNYQKKDVMTTPGMSEPGKNVNDWDAGVPKGSEKPWSGYPSKKNKADKPFNGGKGKQVEEGIEDGTEEQIEESAAECGGRMGAHGRMMGTKSHNPIKAKKNSPMNQHHVSTAGEYDGNPTNESFTRRANKVLKENKELKGALTTIMEELKNAAVTNKNLANIIKLVTENTTSQDEKNEIITRFAKEAKTVEQSQSLYESLSRDLKKANKMNITENKSLTVNGSKQINETTIYKSPDVLDSLDLMHRMMK